MLNKHMACIFILHQSYCACCELVLLVFLSVQYFTHVDRLLRQQQDGFRRGRSCTDQIFTLRQIIIEKVTEGRRPVIVNFIDFRKAFDSIHRPALWKILQQYGLPTKIVTVIQKLYEESSSAVRVNGDTSSWLLLMTNRKSHLGFRLTPRSMTLDDPELL